MTDGLRFWKKIRILAPGLLLALTLLSGCGRADSAGQEEDISPEPTGILMPMASFEKVDIDIQERMPNDWYWSGEYFYYADAEWDGEVGARFPVRGWIERSNLSGTSKETFCEREKWLFYHLFEGKEGQICAFAGDWSDDEKRYYLVRIDGQGQEIARFPVEAEEITEAPGLACKDAGTDAEGNVAMLGISPEDRNGMGYVLYLFGEDGTYIGKEELEFEDPKILDLGEIGLYLYDDAGENPLFAEVDFGAGGVKDAEELPLSSILPGDTRYASYDVFGDPEKGILISETHGLYRYDPAAGKAEKLLSWEAPEVNVEGDLVGQIRFGEVVGETPDGSACQNLVALYNTGKWAEDEPELVRIEYVDRAYLPKRQTVVIGTGIKYGDLEDSVRRFNRSNQQYKVELREYDTDTMLDELIRDKENVPDILNLSFLDTEVLAGKGLLEDLEPYFAESAVVKKEDILPGVWEAGILDGKLRECIVSFTLETLWCSDGELFRGGWGAEEIVNLAERYPGVPLSAMGEGNWQLLSWMSGIGAERFIDTEKGTCSFDSPEFTELLEKLKGPAGLPPWSGQILDRQDSFLNREYLFYNGYYDGIHSFASDRESFLGKAANIGLPFSGEERYLMNSRQQYGIFGLSECRDGAWAFLEYLLEEENQLWSEQEFKGFPVRRDALELYLTREYSKNQNTAYRRIKGMNEAREEMRQMLDHMRPASRLYTSKISRILSEEIPYCWEGDKSPEETAAAIQSRVKIYLKENR